jgi:uncharacterized protein
MNLIHRDARFEIKEVSDSGVFSGYGSVYDVVDQGDDIMAPNVFSDSLTNWQAKGQMPALLWQHNPREPIGTYNSMREDGKGLAVEGQLALKTQRGLEAYELLKMKALNGLSVGFLTREDSMDRKTGIRTIKKADLWEVSLVTFPMNESARVDQVKSIPKFETPSDLERYLRDVYGATKSEARAIVSEALTMFRRDAGSVESSQAILNALARHTAAMRS